MTQDRFVPLRKQSKRAQKEFFSRHRGDWNGVSPVTRQIPDKRKTTRTKEQTRSHLEDR